jgi:hypothetical protein|nr:MAG TPA: transmembrane protein [Caudoviricetes sp.]
MDIFLNEIAEAEKIIESKDLGVKPSQSLFLLAKYYRYVMKYKKSKIITVLTDFIKSTGINYRPSDWEKSVERQVDRTRNNPPINIEYIGITQKELEDIARLKSPPVERIAFTALCLAKYRNILNARNNNWVCASHKMLFSLSSVNKTKYEKEMMIHKLVKAGMLQPAFAVGNTNLKVKFIDDNSPIVLKITDMRELGKEYMLYRGKKYVRCKNCGRLFNKRANNQVYCKNCQGYQKIKTKTLTCCDCGSKFVVDARNMTKTRCDECQKLRERLLTRNRVAKCRNKS